ncbi:protein takeout-like [Sitophilus oryzae]|uniref:Protein takeout-like n=1 Tax=Sitophilus oryzae TaxID=7048 RepID=A0A6J2X8U6_SITOR|nr:protein takeout-like [Sitophilus oryzae]
MENIVILICTLIFYQASAVVFFPPEVEFCQRDENLSECYKEQITKCFKIFKSGSQQLGIPKLDPFYVPKVDISGSPGQSIALNQSYYNMYTYGISTSYIDESRVDLDKCYWSLLVTTPVIRIETDYHFNGKVLLLPIDSQGKCNVTIINLRNHHQSWCERYKKKGKSHIRITNYTMNMLADDARFDFQPAEENSIIEKVIDTVNEESIDTFNDLKIGFQEIWSALHMQTANNVFSKIPDDELFPY